MIYCKIKHLLNKELKLNTNHLTINFEKPIHGWLGFSIKSNNKSIINISASGVFNPFWEYVDILDDIKHKRKKEITFYIDQEGYDAKITFLIRNKYIYLTTETLRNNKKDLPKYTGVFDRQQVIKEMKQRLLKLYSQNKKEMNSYFYPFTFNYGKLIRI